MDQQEQQLINRIKQAQNVLVTVSNDPSVDQLAAAIGLTIALNKLDKHGTAVFSGQIPSTIGFLKPESTLEKNTDSLRDFIIALDKSKADKLRYKVEDQVVRIFITPYKTSLSDKDLEFSQGDFNVDVVIALGVADQKDIDSAIAAHGRILHDAAVASISVTGEGKVGSINWANTSASSLSEMVLNLIDAIDKKLLDDQIATALLTGIVANTDRFRNEQTSPKTMTASAELMAAGADQRLIASELEAPIAVPEPEPEAVSGLEPIPGPGGPVFGQPPEPPASEVPLMSEPEAAKTPPPSDTDSATTQTADAPPSPGAQIVPTKPEPGELDIDHDDEFDKQELAAPAPDADLGEDKPKEPEPQQPQIHVDEDGTLRPLGGPNLPEISPAKELKPDNTANQPGIPKPHDDRQTGPGFPADTNLTANISEEEPEPSTEELTLPPVNAPLLNHNESVLPPIPEPQRKPDESPFIPQAPLQPAPQNWQPPELPNATPPMPSTPLSPLSLPPAQPVPPVPTLTLPDGSATPPPVGPPPLVDSVPQAPPLAPAPMSSPPVNPPLSAPASPFNAGQFPSAPPVSPASASLIPNETLADIEQAVHSPHTQPMEQAGPMPSAHLNDARNAVQAAYNGSSAQNTPLQPITALNAMPLGSELHPPVGQSNVPNPGFSEPTPGKTPADATLDMPLPANPFGPGSSNTLPPPAPAPTLPGTLPQMGNQNGGQNPAPPVPPPMLPQL